MIEEGYWRLMGQETYLKGITLVYRKYRQYKKNPDWDHDHCSFCWVEFSLEGCVDSIQEGYATEDGYHWICPKCFNDFKDRFQWKVVEAQEDIEPDAEANRP
jgi:hypothetical protein